MKTTGTTVASLKIIKVIKDIQVLLMKNNNLNGFYTIQAFIQFALMVDANNDRVP